MACAVQIKREATTMQIWLRAFLNFSGQLSTAIVPSSFRLKYTQVRSLCRFLRTSAAARSFMLLKL
jgi:hypothetical protein